MRAVKYTPEGMKLGESPEPQIVRDTDVKIRIAYAGVCGSDLHIAKKELDFLIDPTTVGGHAMGHEATGVITEIGPKATLKGLKVGDKVTYYYNEHCGVCHYCRNGQEQFCTNMVLAQTAMADYIVVGEQAVYKISDDLGLMRGALIEPISVCLRGIDLCRIKPGQSVAIIGGGTMGLLLLQLAKLAGGTKLTVSEPIPMKRELATKLGARYTIDPFKEDLKARAMEITDGRGFDVVIEASGSVKACPGAYSIVGRGGTLEFFAALYEHTYDFPLNLLDVFFKEITIIGGVFQSPYLFPRSLALADEMDLDSLLVDGCVFEAEQCAEAFQAQMDGKTIKSLIKFS